MGFTLGLFFSFFVVASEDSESQNSLPSTQGVAILMYHHISDEIHIRKQCNRFGKYEYKKLPPLVMKDHWWN